MKYRVNKIQMTMDPRSSNPFQLPAVTHGYHIVIKQQQDIALTCVHQAIDAPVFVPGTPRLAPPTTTSPCARRASTVPSLEPSSQITRSNGEAVTARIFATNSSTSSRRLKVVMAIPSRFWKDCAPARAAVTLSPKGRRWQSRTGISAPCCPSPRTPHTPIPF